MKHFAAALALALFGVGAASAQDPASIKRIFAEHAEQETVSAAKAAILLLADSTRYDGGAAQRTVSLSIFEDEAINENFELLIALKTPRTTEELDSMGVNYSRSQIMMLSMDGYIEGENKVWRLTDYVKEQFQKTLLLMQNALRASVHHNEQPPLSALRQGRAHHG